MIRPETFHWNVNIYVYTKFCWRKIRPWNRSDSGRVQVISEPRWSHIQPICDVFESFGHKPVIALRVGCKVFVGIVTACIAWVFDYTFLYLYNVLWWKFINSISSIMEFMSSNLPVRSQSLPLKQGGRNCATARAGNSTLERSACIRYFEAI